MTLILFVLFVVNAFYFSSYYKNWQSYYERTTEKQGYNDSYRMHRLPPTPAVFCSAGNELQQSVNLWGRLEQLGFWQRNSEKGNIFTPPHRFLDWIFIVEIPFSLLMILYSYNLFSEDREQRTLSLICSHAVSRWKIYLAKVASVMTMASAALLIGMVLGLTTILLIGGIPLNADLIIRLGLLYLISLLYGAVFVLAGTACSILAGSSVLSLLTATAAWLMIVIIIPASIDVSTRHFQKEPTNYELSEMFENAEMSNTHRLFELRKRMVSEGPYPEKDKQKLIDDIKREIRAIGDATVTEERRVSDYVLTVHLNRYQEREKWLAIMPSALFVETTERCVYAGNYRFIDFIEQVRAFSTRFQDEIFKRYGIKRSDYEYVFAKIGDEDIEIRPERVTLDTRDLTFIMQTPSLAASLAASLKGIAGLLLFCVICVVWGFVGFIRADVR